MDPHDRIPRIVLAQTNILEGADVSSGGELMSQLGQIRKSGAQPGSPLYPQEQTSPAGPLGSDKCRYCCKSRKSNNPKNLAKVDLWTPLLLRRFSTPLRRSVIDFG